MKPRRFLRAISVFAEKEVLFAGQSVLAVAADTIEIARKAAHKAVVTYEVLARDTGCVHTARREKSFVGDPYTMQIGDAAAGIKGSPSRIVGRNGNRRGQDHFYLEGQVALATPLENGEIHCWSSTQHPSEVQHLIAKVLGIAEHAVTVEVRRMGGAFGGKESQASLFRLRRGAAGAQNKLSRKNAPRSRRRHDHDGQASRFSL